MLFSYKKHISLVCSKTGKPIKQKSKFYWLKWLCPVTGLFALIWFLIRVIPKPSRAAYPCQRVAFPLASSFIIWLLGLAGSAAAYHKAKRAIAKARYITAAICIIASVAFIWMAMSSTKQEPVYAHEPIVHNAPMGVGKGVNPGRVAWIYDPNSANWTGSDGSTTPPFWYDNACTDQQVVNSMMSKSLRALTGEVTDSAAWDAIFRNFNQQKGRGNVGYTPGEKIAIKINFVLMVNQLTGTLPTGYRDNVGNSPQLAIALLRQLIDVAGVDPCNISIGDPQNCMADYFYNIVGPNCPGVVYLTRSDVNLPGRTKVTADNDANFYWSDPCAAHWSGVTNTDKIPTHFSQATYFINFPVLKSHNSGGITLSGKNFYGALMRAPNTGGYYNMHWTRPHCADTPVLPEVPGMGYYRANVDLMGHPKLGGKTLLVLIDGLYSGRSWDSETTRWNMAPFNGDWPSSIFLSQDQVAADSVAFDFMDNEWNGSVGTLNGYPQYSGTDDYLHEAALAYDPCSGATYDPNHDGGPIESLGVHEHWNNATNKQYSQNLGTGNGIELVKYAPGWPDISGDGVVNFEDFAILANAWRSTTGGANYDANCDISSTPGDGVINEKDLVILFENWLADFTDELVMPGALPQEVYSASGINFEGPTWDPNSDKLFFTRRTTPYQILRLDGPNTVYLWLNPSPQTNGTIMSLDGRLLACDESPRQISSRRIDPCGPGDTIILADANDGFTKPPNDLCQLANGNIYFTTPIWDSSPPSSQGVWLLEPNGAVRQVNGTLYQPNGIITSLDETKLYVSEGSSTTAYQRWWVFNIDPNGNLSGASIFFNPSSAPDRTNVPDGMTIDERGNLYFTGLGGVWIVSPAGMQLKFISMPNAPFNIAFGGTNGRTLYMTCKNKVYSLAMCVRGGEATSW
jgi:sugar lactone lactonase YvrE